MSSLLMKSKGSVDRNSLNALNVSSTQALSSSNLLSLNRTTSNNSSIPNNVPLQSQVTKEPQATPVRTQVATQAVQATPNIPAMPTPALNKPIQKGQKASLFNKQSFTSLKACLGWNVTHADCDIDVSAFLLNENDKVIGDDWFVFYGQPTSPDNSTKFFVDNKTCREAITIDFKSLNPAVKKIVFVLTINEAVEKKLNFSMINDAYIKLIDNNTQVELVSFKMTDYYSNVISMMIGEVYAYNDMWKFNAIGNGVAKDLAGLCGIYGVQIDD